MTAPLVGYSREPFFFDAPSGRLFSLLYEPHCSRRGQVLFCPPFAEEMNKSRRMMTLAAQRLAEAGYATLILDLYGTGDSSGVIEDARWQTWVSDLEQGLSLLSRDSSARTSLCGIRLGAALAFELCRRQPESIEQLLLWQPVVMGKTHLTQFLRLKIAAQLTAAGPKTSTKELREAAANGDVVEVAGYALHPDLMSAIDAIDLRGIEPPEGLPIGWYEVVADEGGSLAVASRKLGDAWREAGIDIDQVTIEGEPFWTTQEIGLSRPLVEQTVNRIAAD